MLDIDQKRLRGVLLGTAIGDAIGLPYEGLSRARVERRLAKQARQARLGGLRHSLVFGRGMVSDDTEHACMTALALLESGGEMAKFGHGLARRLRMWLLALPPATGLATARGIVRLWLGRSPERSGVDSAGNGPLMRAAAIGVLANDEMSMRAAITIATRITHTDPRAEQAALAIARLAREPDCIESVIADLADPELQARVNQAWTAARTGASLDVLRDRLGFDWGVSGFVNDTLPAVVYCALRWPDDPRAAIEAAVRLGGDTDSVAALVGALAGARLGAEALPREWIAGVCDWPIGIGHIERIADALERESANVRTWWLAHLVRNLVMLAIVLGHACVRGWDALLIRGLARR